MGKVIIIPNADFSDNAIVYRGVTAVTSDGLPINATFYRVPDSELVGVVKELNSGVLEEFPAATSETRRSISSMFYNATPNDRLKSIEMFWDKTFDMAYTFYNCAGLKDVYLRGAVRGAVDNTFISCTSLESLDLSNLDLTEVTSLSSFMQGCVSLKKIRFSAGCKPTMVNSMFYGCINLEEVDLSGFDFSEVTSATTMFAGSGVRIINWGKQDFSKLSIVTGMINQNPLEKVYGELSNLGKSIDYVELGENNALDRSSLLVFINGLYDNTGSSTQKRFWMTSANYESLTAEDISKVTAKNWVIKRLGIDS